MPQKHPLSAIRKIADAVFVELSPQFDKLYARMGRPLFAPEKLLPALLQVLYSLGINEIVFIPRRTSYSVQVLTDEGARVLRIELPNAGSSSEETAYDARVWQGPLTNHGLPYLDLARAKNVDGL